MTSHVTLTAYQIAGIGIALWGLVVLSGAPERLVLARGRPQARPVHEYERILLVAGVCFTAIGVLFLVQGTGNWPLPLLGGTYLLIMHRVGAQQWAAQHRWMLHPVRQKWLRLGVGIWLMLGGAFLALVPGKTQDKRPASQRSAPNSIPGTRDDAPRRSVPIEAPR